jgi:hypothetical protein
MGNPFRSIGTFLANHIISIEDGFFCVFAAAEALSKPKTLMVLF